MAWLAARLRPRKYLAWRNVMILFCKPTLTASTSDVHACLPMINKVLFKARRATAC